MRWLAHRAGDRFRAPARIRASLPGRGGAGLRSGDHPRRGDAGAGSLSEYQFAGLAARAKTELVKCLGSDLQVPASAEIVLEGASIPGDMAPKALTATTPATTTSRLRVPGVHHRAHHHAQARSDLPAPTPASRPTSRRLGVALNEVFVPLLQKQFTEIVDFYLPPEGCSYRLAVVSIRKQYPATPNG